MPHTPTPAVLRSPHESELWGWAESATGRWLQAHRWVATQVLGVSGHGRTGGPTLPCPAPQGPV